MSALRFDEPSSQCGLSSSSINFTSTGCVRGVSRARCRSRRKTHARHHYKLLRPLDPRWHRQGLDVRKRAGSPVSSMEVNRVRPRRSSCWSSIAKALLEDTLTTTGGDSCWQWRRSISSQRSQKASTHVHADLGFEVVAERLTNGF